MLLALTRPAKHDLEKQWCQKKINYPADLQQCQWDDHQIDDDGKDNPPFHVDVQMMADLRIHEFFSPCIHQHGKVTKAHQNEVDAIDHQADGFVQVVCQKARGERNQADKHQKNDVEPNTEDVHFGDMVMIEVCVDPKGTNNDESQKEDEQFGNDLIPHEPVQSLIILSGWNDQGQGQNGDDNGEHGIRQCLNPVDIEFSDVAQFELGFHDGHKVVPSSCPINEQVHVW